MTRFLPKEIRKWILEMHARYSFMAYRRVARARGVFIHADSYLVGTRGISIGKGTKIGRNATIAATSLSWNDNYMSPPHGTIQIGENCSIFSGAILASYGGEIILEDKVTVNPYCILYGHGGLHIGTGTRIATHTIIIPANHNFMDLDRPIGEQGLTCKGIRVGKDVWIGAGVSILDGVIIGNGCVLAAGCVVTKDVPSYTVVAGVPARVIKKRSSDSNHLKSSDQ